MNKQNIEAIYPLSPVQQGMLLDTVTAPGKGRHIEQFICLIQKEIDPLIFEKVWQQMIDRHTIFRTGFVWKEQDQPLQVVLRQVKVPLKQQDWRELPTGERQKQLEIYLQADGCQDFELSRPPLMRLAIFRLEEDKYQWVWTHHHMILDGWSLFIILKEFLECYQALSQNHEVNLEPRRPYQDYIAWLKTQDLSRAEAFWRQVLKGFKEPTPLSSEIDTTPVSTAGAHQYGQHKLDLPIPTSTAIQSLVQSYRLTMNTVIQGIWALLLSRYSGKEDVVFGATVSGRPLDLVGSESMVGIFINTVPIRVKITANTSFLDWLKQLKDDNLRLQPFEYNSSGQIQQWSEIPGSLPLFESLLVFENYPTDLTTLSSFDLTKDNPQVQIEGARTRYALTLLVTAGTGLTIQIIYDKRRFQGEDCKHILEHFLVLCEDIGANPEQHLAALLDKIPGEQIPTMKPLHKHPGKVSTHETVAPQTMIEKALVGIWAHVLGVEPVGIYDDFFQLGGHSLLATQLVSLVRSTFQVELTFKELLRSPTVAGVAVHIAQHKGLQADGEYAAAQLPTIVSNPEQKYQPFPLTDIQQAYLIGRNQDFELGNVTTHAYLEIEIHSLDPVRLNRAWQKLIQRHDMLRAIVLPNGKQQILEKIPAYQIKVADLRDFDSHTIAYRLEARREQMSHQVFKTHHWPLFDICVSLVNDNKAILHLSYDLLICDAWSFEILSGELHRLYRQPMDSLVPLEISFRDYVLALHKFRDSELYRQSLEYWRHRIKELPPSPELPLAKNPGSLARPRFKRLSTKLEPAAWSGLKKRAICSGLTPSGVLLAVFAEILTLWSKSPCFTINLTLFNRLPFHPQVNRLVGDFTSLTLLTVDYSNGEPFQSRARRLQEQLWEDMEHRYVSGVTVMRELARIRGGNVSAMMPVVFTSTLTLEGFSLNTSVDNTFGEIIYGVGQTPQVWLDNQVTEQKGTLNIWWDAVEELFPAGLLQEMFDAYRCLLDRLVLEEKAWQETTGNLEPLTRLQQPEAGYGAKTPVSTEMLQTLFNSQVPHRRYHPAVVTPEQTVTYDQLYCFSQKIGVFLRTLGARPNSLVAVVMEKGWEQIAAVLGILQAGAAYLPINPDSPPKRLDYMLTNGKVQWVLTQSHLDHNLEWPEHVCRICIDENPFQNGGSPSPDPVQTPDDLAYVIYTSGSTGLPKGVMIDHRAAVNTILDINRRFNVGREDRVLALSSLSFDLSVYDIFGLLAAGGTIIIPGSRAAREPAHWARLITEKQVTLWNSVPTLMEMLTEYITGQTVVPATSLRLVLLSGDWIPVTLPDRVKALFKGVRVISLGGATEASIWSILYPVEMIDPGWKSIPYGQPMTNQAFYVLNDALEPRPVWVPGQLYIGGIGLAKGYWQDEEKTNAHFFVHPQWSERLYRTRDLGRYLPDGNIEFLGREDLQVKIQGHRVELGEIEAVLAEHPAVEMAVVTAAGEQHPGKYLAAYVVLNREKAQAGFEAEKGETTVNPSHWESSLDNILRNYLLEKLPEYMVPTVFVPLDTLPVTPNGKVNRSALPVIEHPGFSREAPGASPDRPIEEILTGLWADVLEVEHVDIHDNFFRLGGDSLSATRLISLIRKTFRVELPLRILFESPSASGMARHIETAGQMGEGTALPPVIPTTAGGEAPLSFAQQGIWFMDRLIPGNPSYNVPGALLLTGLPDISALSQTLNEMVRRHEILRTVFVIREQQPVQVVVPLVSIDLPIIDLSQLPESEKKAEAEALVSQEALRSFDLTQSPLLQTTLLRLNEMEHVLLFNMHHIISDAWSLGILVREVVTLYQAFSRGKSSPLPGLSLQYSDYAAWQRQWLKGKVLETLMDYWKKQLANASPLLLPTHYPRSTVYTFRGASRYIELPANLTGELKALSRQDKATLFMILLAVFKILLYHYTQKEDIVIGTSIANRNHAELEGLIGCFVNLLVLRTGMSGNPSFRELLRRVRRVALEAYLHKDLPYEKLVEEFKPVRDLSRSTSLVHVLFVLENVPMPTIELPGLTVCPFEYDREVTRFDINFHFMETAQGLRGTLHFNRDLFESAFITRILKHYEKLLKHVVQKPNAKLKELTRILAESEGSEKQQWLSRLKESKQESLNALKKRRI